MAREYAAFISYRHAEVDSRVAAEVQRALERYHVPLAVQKQTGRKNLAPIFRDKEELPVTAELSDDIGSALANSRHLIVICSPRLKESTWCQREIETFLKTHPAQDVLTVLAEGEPYDVIPEVLLKRPKMVELEDGTTREVLVDAEPLSCDFRSPRRRDHRTEVTRLAAAMLGVPYDSLVRRQQRYRRRVAAAFGVAAAAVMAYGAWSLVTIRNDYTRTLKNQSQTLARDAKELHANGSTLEAIELSLAALPGEGGERPVVAQAELALQEISRAYVPISSMTPLLRAGAPDYDAARSFDLRHEVQGIECSYDGSVVAAWSYSGDVACWDVETGSRLYEQDFGRFGFGGMTLPDGHSFIVAGSDEVLRVSLDDGSTVWRQASRWEVDDELEPLIGPSFLVSDAQLDDRTGQFVVTDAMRDSIVLLDAETGSVNGLIPYKELGDPFYEGTPDMEVGEGLCALARGTDDGYGVCVLALADLETGEARLSKDRFEKAVDLTALPEGRVLVTSLGSDPEVGAATFWSNGGVIEAELNSYTQRLSCVDIHTGETLWAQDIALWQPVEGISAFCTELDLGKGKPEEVLVWCGANVCAWLDLGTGELLGSVETPASFVSAWVRTAAGDITDDVPSSIEGCLFTGEYVVCTPQREQSLSVKTYPSYANAALSRETGEFVTQGDTVLLFAPGQGDASWKRVTDEYYDNQCMRSTPAGLLALDQYGMKNGGAPRVSLFDLTQGSLAWETPLDFWDGERSKTMLGLSPDGESYFLAEKSISEDTCDIARLSMDDGAAELLTMSSVVPDTEGASLESLCGEGATLAGNCVVSCIKIEEPYGYRLCATDLATMESALFDAGVGTSTCGVGNPTGMAVMPSAYAEIEDVSGVYQCVAIDTVSGASWQLDVPVTSNMTYLAGTTHLDAVWGDDDALYVRSPDSLVAYDRGGTRRFAIDLGRAECLGMGVNGSELVVVMRYDNNLVLRWYDAKDGRQLGECAPDLELDSDAEYRNIECKELPDDAMEGADVFALSIDSSTALIDRSGQVYQIVKYCDGYDSYADAFVVESPIYGDDGFGVCPRHDLGGLVTRAQEQLGDSRMSEERRKEFGL